MVDINRYRAVWSGFPGGPGVSTFYGQASTDLTVALRTFFSNVRDDFPEDVAIQVEGSGDTIDSVTGVLSGTWSSDVPAVVTGSASSSYSAASGVVVTWDTNAVVGGKRLRGRTFLVPLAGVRYDAQGSLSAEALGTIRPAASGLVSSNVLYVWHRPRAATPAWTDVRGRLHPARAATVGSVGEMVAARVADKVAVLRSRRD